MAAKSSTTFLQSCIASLISNSMSRHEALHHCLLFNFSKHFSIFHNLLTLRYVSTALSTKHRIFKPWMKFHTSFGTVHFYREQSTDSSQIFGLYRMFGKFASLRIIVHCTLHQWFIVSGMFLQHIWISPRHLRSHEKQTLTQKELLLETNGKLCISVTNGLSITVFGFSTGALFRIKTELPAMWSSVESR